MPREGTPHDLFGPARTVLIVAWAFAALVVLSILLDTTIGPTRPLEREEALVRGLDLSAIALVPSGRSLRNPEALHPAVDLRFSPGLPGIGTTLSDLLVRNPTGPVGRVF